MTIGLTLALVCTLSPIVSTQPPLPPLDQTVIYEENLRAEGSPNAFLALSKRLPSIKKLGVNVLWLMPVQPVGKLRSAGGLGSPYATANFDTVNPEFGTPAELHKVIDGAHKLGIAVLIDWVANHTAWDHPWIKAHPDWYLHDAAGNISIPPGTNWQDVAKLKYDVAPMRQAMIVAMKGWVSNYGIDGFRCDSADNVPYDFWKEAVLAIRSASPKPLLMLAEGYRTDHYTAGFNLTYGWRFADRLRAIYKGKSASELANANREETADVPKGSSRLRFSTNHDIDAWDGAPIEFFLSSRGVRAAFVVTALYGGVPLIYSGQEVGWERRIPIFDRTSIDWSNVAESKWMSVILDIRNQSASTDNPTVDFSTADVIAFLRRTGSIETLVLANVRDRSHEISIPESFAGRWRDAESKTMVALARTYTLSTESYRILRRKVAN